MVQIGGRPGRFLVRGCPWWLLRLQHRRRMARVGGRSPGAGAPAAGLARVSDQLCVTVIVRIRTGLKEGADRVRNSTRRRHCYGSNVTESMIRIERYRIERY